MTGDLADIVIAAAWFAAGNLLTGAAVWLVWLGLRSRRFGAAGARRAAAAGALFLPAGVGQIGLAGWALWRELAVRGWVPGGGPRMGPWTGAFATGAMLAVILGAAALGAAAGAALNVGRWPGGAPAPPGPDRTDPAGPGGG